MIISDYIHIGEMLMNTLGKILKEYRKNHGMSMATFAELSGLSKSYISMLENNKDPRGNPITPSVETINRVAKAMGRTFESVFNELDSNVSVSVNNSGIPQNAFAIGKYRIPVVATVAAGEPIFSEESILEWIDYDKDPRGEVFGLRIKGDSMIPRISDGDTIVVDKSAVWEDGDIVVVTVNGNDGTCKRIKKYKDGISLISLNPSYEPIFFTKSQVEELPVRVVGRVMESRSRF